MVDFNFKQLFIPVALLKFINRERERDNVGEGKYILRKSTLDLIQEVAPLHGLHIYLEIRNY